MTDKKGLRLDPYHSDAPDPEAVDPDKAADDVKWFDQLKLFMAAANPDIKDPGRHRAV